MMKVRRSKYVLSWKVSVLLGVFLALSRAQASSRTELSIPGVYLAVSNHQDDSSVQKWAVKAGVEAHRIPGSTRHWEIRRAGAWSEAQILGSGLFEEVQADAWMDSSWRSEEVTSGFSFLSVLPESLAKFLLPDDVPLGSNWALERIHAPEAWTRRTSTDDVIVAVLDSGVDVDHPDLAANIWRNEDEIPGNGIDDDHNGWVDDIHGYDSHFERVEVQDQVGHGTYLAGIIGAVGNNGIGSSGVAWRTRMMVIRGDDARRMSWTGAIKGAYYARDNGARVINASWGTYSATTGLRQMLLDMEAAGVMVVNAVGNNSNNVDTQHRAYPSGYATSNLIAVSALHPNGSLVHYADHGEKYVHLAAPGWGIPTTALGGKYTAQAGCSVATPFVTAAVAMVWAEHPEWSHHQVRDQILSTVDVLPTLRGKVATSGVLNLGRALGVETTR